MEGMLSVVVAEEDIMEVRIVFDLFSFMFVFIKLLFDIFNFFFFQLLGGGGVDERAAGGGSSYSTSPNTIYTTGYQAGDGSITIEFFPFPIFKFSCTKTIQNVTVPEGYKYMSVDISGAASGYGGTGSGSTPGYGARVTSNFTVTAGTVLHLVVGCRGTACPTATVSTSAYVPGGYNGGGSGYITNNGDIGGSGGGGASDIRIGGLSLLDRTIVAGGGGGYYCGASCGAAKGGDAGRFGLSGSITGYPSCTGFNHRPGGGGNWTSGGAAAGSTGIPNPTRGTLGVGGNGGFGHSGGGGGGYYGGKIIFC
jgi:hypothetical protein